MKRYIQSSTIYADELQDPVEDFRDNYILYTADSKEVFNTFDEAVAAYKSIPHGRPKFLYQPDKTYFLGTLSSTGYRIGHDHAYHKDTAKCYGLFIARNVNQISTFLSRVAWKHKGSSTKSSSARLYGNGPYGSLYKVDRNVSTKDWDRFEYALQRDYLWESNIQYTYLLDSGFGAIDVTNTERMQNPYALS